MKIVEQILEESNAYSLFVYAIRSQVTRDYYLRRLRIFFNYIDLQSDLSIEEDAITLQIREQKIRLGHLIA